MKPENRFFFWMYLISNLPFMVWIPVIVSDIFHPPWITLISVITLTFAYSVNNARLRIQLDEMQDTLNKLEKDGVK